MKNKARLLSAILLSIVTAASAIAQTETGVKPSVVTGEVISIDSAKIVLKTDSGPIDVILSEKAEFKRVTPENPSLKAAVAGARSEIAAGDKLVVTGILSADKKNLPARTVYLMTRSDIEQKQLKENEKWRTRGITGRVASVDLPKNQISVEIRGLTGVTTLVLTPKETAKFKRYVPNSVKFSEAKDSALAEVQTGDMIRAVGDRSADGTGFAAEEVVTGAFQTVAGTVKSVDAAKNEVTVAEFRTKKDVVISLESASMLKKFPEEMARRLAGGPAGPGQNGVRPVRPRPEGAEEGATPSRRGPGGGMGRAGGIDEMLERFPNITIADLKVGDVIAVSSTKTATLDRINAIKLLAGVEPFLQAAPANGNGGRSQGGQTGSFNIPGLEGFDAP